MFIPIFNTWPSIEAPVPLIVVAPVIVNVIIAPQFPIPPLATLASAVQVHVSISASTVSVPIGQSSVGSTASSTMISTEHIIVLPEPSVTVISTTTGTGGIAVLISSQLNIGGSKIKVGSSQTSLGTSVKTKSKTSSFDSVKEPSAN